VLQTTLQDSLTPVKAHRPAGDFDTQLQSFHFTPLYAKFKSFLQQGDSHATIQFSGTVANLQRDFGE
jgi:hypothetical protein